MVKIYTFSRHKTLCIAAAVAILVTFVSLRSFTDHNPSQSASSFSFKTSRARIGTGPEADGQTFYDDPEVGYTIDNPVINWDQKRRVWLKKNPTFWPRNGDGGVLVVTGSQPWPCTNPSGDHFLLRFFKNKVDYCRIHGYQIYYNNAFLHPQMRGYWAKGPILRAAMVAHPEVEWLFWVDSDAVFTDMEFKIPFERYKDHNLVVYGWPDALYQNKSWVSLNAGVLLLRNCQWSMDFLDVWTRMGPKSQDHAEWGQILQSALSDMKSADADDQSAMVYLLVAGDKKWREKTHVETRYALSGYWLDIVDQYDDIAKKYEEVEKGVGKLRRWHAEVQLERYLPEYGSRQRPFVTHFTGCEPCAGEPNAAFKGNSCRVGIERALHFADNQVLRSYGFVRPEINGSDVRLLPLDYDV